MIIKKLHKNNQNKAYVCELYVVRENNAPKKLTTLSVNIDILICKYATKTLNFFIFIRVSTIFFYKLLNSNIDAPSGNDVFINEVVFLYWKILHSCGYTYVYVHMYIYEQCETKTLKSTI